MGWGEPGFWKKQAEWVLAVQNSSLAKSPFSMSKTIEIVARQIGMREVNTIRR